MIPALRNQRQADPCEFKVSLVYKASSRTSRVVTQKKPCLEKPKPKEKNASQSINLYKPSPYMAHLFIHYLMNIKLLLLPFNCSIRRLHLS